MSILAAALTILVAYYMYLCMEWPGHEGVSRGQAAKMLALMQYDRQACETLLKNLHSENLPKDIYGTQWYDKYAVAVMNENWLETDEDGLFHPTDYLTYGDLETLIQKFHISEDWLSFSMKYRQSDAIVSKKHWCEVYSLMIIDCPKVQKKSYILYQSASNRTDLGAWEILTDCGVKSAEGISVDDAVGKRIEVYEAEDEILCIISALEEVNDEMTMQNEAETLASVEDKSNQTIRVLLQGAFDGYGHEYVQFTSTDTFYVITKESVREYMANSKVTISSEDEALQQGNIRIRTVDPRKKIQLMSIERACGNPSYHGEIELQKSDEGILVINEVDLEDYVAGVIPGEMPVSYGMEALKAQAVCARTFGMRALEGTFRDYPANLDDTVYSQVYNNQEECEESIEAEMATKGQVLKNAEGLTATYFFSTSCGHTSLPEEVWYNGDELAVSEAMTVFLSDESVGLSLDDEADFREFIQCSEDISYYEEDLPWFRWKTFIKDEVIEENVQWVCGETIGDLINVEVLERGISGVLKAIQINGTSGTCIVYGEYRMRQIFSPEDAELTLQNGECVTDLEMLPSGYFYMDALDEEGVCAGYMVYGGGYGHGCGMSQNGAMKMAEAGKTYEEILAYFFADSRLS